MANTTSYLQGARDLSIQNISITHSGGRGGKSAMEYLQYNIAVGAIHNSDERCDAPTCYPETRKAVQEDIMSWITHGDQDAQPVQLMWLSGPAGSGKTAIAGSIAEMCEEKEILAGSYFFSSFSPSPERSSKKYLVATLVYQLLLHDGLESMEQHVLRALQRDPAIFKKKLKVQLEALILKPLRMLHSQLSLDSCDLPKVVIVDGVDEVKAEKQIDDPSHRTTPRLDEDDHHEIISCLLHAARDSAFPFRILVVSRPERTFTEFFSEHGPYCRQPIFLDEKYDPGSDIRLYLTSTFADLRRRYQLSRDWPTEPVIARLVVNASGQFIYAATVVRFITDGTNPPPAQLNRLLNIVPHDSDANPLGALHELYKYVLMSSPKPAHAARWILAIAAETGLSAWACRLLFESEEGEAEHLLRPCASLVHIPAPPADRTARYQVHHKSLFDFLRDEDCCPGSFYVDGHPTRSLSVDTACEGGWCEFMTRSWTYLLTRKGPRLPISNEEKEEFLDAVFHPPTLLGRDAAMMAACLAAEEELQPCDLYWCAFQILSRLHLTGALDQRQLGVTYTLGYMIWNVHQTCPQGECTGLCKSWVADLTKACQECGWSIPGEGWLQRYRTLDSGEKVMVYGSYESVINALKPPPATLEG